MTLRTQFNDALKTAMLGKDERGVTAIRQITAKLKDLDIAALADPGATTCVFMGKATFAALAEKLIAHGLSEETPAVVVESLGSPTTPVMSGTLTEIAARLTAAKPQGPCIILYGAALAGVGAEKA